MILLLSLLACTGESSTTTPAASMGPQPDAASLPDLAPGDGVVAQWNGGQVLYSDLLEYADGDLKQVEITYLQNRYAVESGALRELALMKMMEAEAAKRNTDLDGLLKAEVEDKVSKPTDAEVEEFYPVIARQLRNAPLDQVRPQVEGYLLSKRQTERMEAYIAELEAAYGFQTQLPFPDMPRIEVSADDDPVLGDPNAPITIVEFADYQCGYCRKIYPTLVELSEEYEGKIKIVYRDYPLSGGAGGLEPSIAANCAGEQDKYWQMHDELMRNTNYSMVGIEAYATKIGLDMDTFKTCMGETARHSQEIMKDFQDGQAAGVNGTPAFFINGVFLNGAQPKEQFVAVIERELGEQG
ncbi:MAG: thioredoxin domain-containing protein [Myxococcota bacterium]|nr:thioredoxin domain-containing protein [Myxococcota bacterium]